MLIIPVRWIAVAAIYFTVLVSMISAIDYFVGFWKQIDHASKDRAQEETLRADAAQVNERALVIFDPLQVQEIDGSH